MFVGIVEEIGLVKHVEHRPDKSTLIIQSQKCLEDVSIGDSISVNGVCLTICQFSTNGFVVEAMPETLRLTTLGTLTVGCLVNLERAMTSTTRVGGHFVQGHVDGTTTIERIEQDGCALKVWLKKLDAYTDCFIAKGYICLDGMSLTLVDVEADNFSICFIPHTQASTIVQNYQVGTKVNLEMDHITKTISIILKQREISYG